ncbi:hypothetical protein AAVH_20820 [Aphelenchoides avenae]|nr:hypothetical protein AAVH_20820 [Aphelenchus avenae]
MGITSIVFGLHTELSDSVQTVCFALFCVDLFGQLVLLALSIFVTDVVRRCAALHDNLKVLLLLKCLSSAVFAVDNLTSKILNLSGVELSTTARAWVIFFGGIPININAWLTVAYTAERVLATLAVKSYERQRPWFGWIVTTVIVVQACYYVSTNTIFSEYTGALSARDTISSYILEALGITCVPVIATLHWYNARRYRNLSDYHKNTLLTERYQNSENVRTTCQLIPLILFHLLSTLSIGTFYVTAVLSFSAEFRFVQRTLIGLVNCFAYIGCQVAVLYFHSGVRRRAIAKLMYAWTLFNATFVPNRHRMVTPSSSTANTIDDGLVYFKRLSENWDRHYEKRANETTNTNRRRSTFPDFERL